jgi:hypothetical protein
MKRDAFLVIICLVLLSMQYVNGACEKTENEKGKTGYNSTELNEWYPSRAKCASAEAKERSRKVREDAKKRREEHNKRMEERRQKRKRDKGEL